MADEDIPVTFSSPACFLYEVDPVYAGLPAAPDLQTWRDVNRWRKAERERLISTRLALSAAGRLERGGPIAARVLEEIGEVEGRIISAYWPFRGEPDLRPLLEEIVRRGGKTALPVVIEKGRPLEFHLWQACELLSRGIWNIPVPVRRRPCVPDIVIAPVIGYDRACYRLGYGGGFFDRTLAAMQTKPSIIGVSYCAGEISTIYPQWHDVPMDLIVTESCMVRTQSSVISSQAWT